MKKPRKLECDECGSTYELAKRRLEGREYELYVCPKCGDTIFTSDQAAAYQELHEIVRIQLSGAGGPLILRKVGNSINATVPRELSRLGFDQGRSFRWEIKDTQSLILHLLPTGLPKKTAPRPRHPDSKR